MGHGEMGIVMKLALVLSSFLHMGLSLGADVDPAIVPPIGNSPLVQAATKNGFQVYTCTGGKWIQSFSWATLVDVNNSNSIVGNFTGKKDRFGDLGTWTIINSPGVAVEGGSEVSSVTGKSMVYVPVQGSLPQMLAMATSHSGSGQVDTLIGYIQRYATSGGLPPNQSMCTDPVEGNIVEVPYFAYYCLWAQDMEPPSLPSSLVVPATHILVEGFFTQGVVSYMYNGSAWSEQERSAKLYNVPGGPELGELGSKSGSNEWWHVYQPNGFFMEGKLCAQPVQVADYCYPWTLHAITQTAIVPLLGDYSYALTVSTKGGAPPTAQMDAATGTIWISPFSSIVWFYK